jgi:hypothetical protein
MLAPFPASGLPACLNRADGSRDVCGFPLAELPTRPATAEVLEVQDLYLRAAAGQVLRLAGKEAAPADWFAEMSQLAALARWAGPQEAPGLDALPGHFAIKRVQLAKTTSLTGPQGHGPGATACAR